VLLVLSVVVCCLQVKYIFFLLLLSHHCSLCGTCLIAHRYAKIISGKISYPESFSNPLEDIIVKLCTKNPSKRLGNMKGEFKS